MSYERAKGNRLLRWTYARWVQLLAHGDLLGPDGRPSQGKLAACTAMAYGCLARDPVIVALALCAAFGRGTLLEGIRSWRGTSAMAYSRERRDVNVTVRTPEQIAAARNPEDGTEPAGKVPQVFDA